MAIEPVLQPLSGESFRYATANVEDEARLDVSAHGFWGSRHQKAFFDDDFPKNFQSNCSQLSKHSGFFLVQKV